MIRFPLYDSGGWKSNLELRVEKGGEYAGACMAAKSQSSLTLRYLCLRLITEHVADVQMLL